MGSTPILTSMLPAHIIAAIIKSERERAELLRKQDEARPRIEIEKADVCEDCWPYRCKCYAPVS